MGTKEEVLTQISGGLGIVTTTAVAGTALRNLERMPYGTRRRKKRIKRRKTTRRRRRR